MGKKKVAALCSHCNSRLETITAMSIKRGERVEFPWCRKCDAPSKRNPAQEKEMESLREELGL